MSAPLPPIAELRAWVTDQVNLNSWITMPGDVVLALLDRVEALERVAQAARDWRHGDDDYAGELLGEVCRAVDELDGDQ